MKEKRPFNKKRPGGRLSYLSLGIISSLIILTAWWLEPGFLTAMELKAADAMFLARGEKPAPGEVVIVAVDEKSINELGRWPWPRKETARLIESLKPAKTVALDIVFSEHEGVEADSILSDAISANGNVVLGYFFRNDTAAEPSVRSLELIAASKVGFINTAEGDSDAEFQGPAFISVEANLPGIGAGASGFGSFNTIPQNDGGYRVSNLLFKYGGEIYPSLALEALRKHLGGEYVLYMAPYGIDGLTLGDRLIHVDERGGLNLNFYGPSGSFRTYSAVDLMAGRISPVELKDKLVFVGVTEKAMYDIRPAPLDPLFPGVEIHATAAGNILKNEYLIRDGRVVAFDVLACLLMPLVLSLAMSSVRRTFTSLLVFGGLLIALVIGEFVMFSAFNIKAAVIYPALSLTLAYMTGEAYRNMVVEKRSRFLRKAFSTYVSPELVTEILKDPERLKLGGEKRVVTVLFSDIRGFTALSEKLSPEELIDLLNRYLSPMTGIVLEEGGMVDKYIGDAIMAVFNAPVEVEGHPARACRTALRMIDTLARLNSGWKGMDDLEIGIGINTGEAVMGNMGAELKLNYTAIGDTVNLASRLEGMNKLYGTSIIVSGFTRELVKDDFVFRELDFVKAKGKERPIAVYELLGMPGATDKLRLSEEFGEALRLYRSRRFREAAEAFRKILSGRSDGPSAVYAQRCDEYCADPPAADWDGVFEAKEK